MHVLGHVHEHKRFDRNKFVTVETNNINYVITQKGATVNTVYGRLVFNVSHENFR